MNQPEWDQAEWRAKETRFLERRKNRVYVRLKRVLPGAGESFFLRQLLLKFPAYSFQDLRSVSVSGERVELATFREV